MVGEGPRQGSHDVIPQDLADLVGSNTVRYGVVRGRGLVADAISLLTPGDAAWTADIRC